MTAVTRRRVLVVEDELSVRELLRLHLDLAGFEIEESADGRDARAGCHGRGASLHWMRRHADEPKLGGSRCGVGRNDGYERRVCGVAVRDGRSLFVADRPLPERYSRGEKRHEVVAHGHCRQRQQRCSPVAGANVEIWQCDADGHYSQYSQPGYNGQSETYLRGIQTTDAAGRVTFTTIYPGWYMGRATHIHVDVAMNGRSVKVTQIAFPENITAALYATGVYAAKGQNPTSNTRDMVFADSVTSEMASVAGDPTNGYNATFTVGIAA